MAQQFDPNDFYGKSTAAPAATPPARHPFGQAPSNGRGAPRPFATKTPVPTWAKVLIALGIAGAAFALLGIIAAVAIPVFLNERASAADAQVKQDLRAVATAQENVWMATGAYTLDPMALGVPEPESDIVIASADTQGFCLAGRGSEQGNVWFYSPDTGVTRTPCA